MVFKCQLANLVPNPVATTSRKDTEDPDVFSIADWIVTAPLSDYMKSFWLLRDPVDGIFSPVPEEGCIDLITFAITAEGHLSIALALV